MPHSLDEALALLNKYGNDCKVIAGGTDLIINLQNHNMRFPVIIDVSKISCLRDISIENHRVKIGASVTLTDLQKSEIIISQADILKKAVQQIGSHQIRNVATLIGNIGNASPAADGVLALLTLNCVVMLDGVHGNREVPIDKFILGPNKIDCAPEELITGVTFPFLGDGFQSSFQKVGLRKAMNIAIVNLSMVTRILNNRVYDVRIALGAVAPTAIRIKKAERELIGGTIDEKLIEHIGDLCISQALPINDIRGSLHYRKKMIRALLNRAFLEMNTQILPRTV